MATPINKIFDDAAIEAQVQKVLASLTAVEAGMNKVQAAANNVKGSASIAALNNAIEALAAATKKQEEASSKLRKEEEALGRTLAGAAAAAQIEAKTMDERTRLSKLYDQALIKLNATLSKEAELHAQGKVAMGEVNKQLRAQAREVLGLVGPYDKLQQEFAEARKRAQDLGATLGITSNEYKAAAAAAVEMNNRLKAIDAGVGNFQRNVGNYASGFRDFGLILRELPNFAISATTGIQSLSNNIPMLADSISLARQQGMSWGSVLRGLAGQIFSFGGVITAVTIAITGLPKIYEALTEKTREAKKAQEEYNKSLAEENTKLTQLFKAASNLQAPMDARVAAVKELRNEYGNYLKNFSDEELLAGKAAKAYDKLSEAIVKMAKAKAASDAISKEFAKVLDLDVQIQEAVAKSNIAIAEMQGKMVRGKTTFANDKELIDRFKKSIEEQLGIPRLQAEKKILEENIARFQNIINQNIVSPFTVEGGQGKSDTEKYYNLVYELQRNSLNNIITVNKAILDNENESFENRAAAAKRLFDAKIALNKINLANQLAEEKFNLGQSLKNTELNNQQREALKQRSSEKEKEIEANSNAGQVDLAVELLTTFDNLNKQFLDKKAKDAKDAAAKQAKDEEDAVKAREAKIEQIILQRAIRTNKALTELNRKYLNGEIKDYEQFTFEKEKLELKMIMNNLAAELVATTAIMGMAKVSTGEREKYELKLSDLKKRLTDANVSYMRLEDSNSKKISEERLRRLQEELQALDQAVKNFSQAIATLTSIQFENRQAQLETERNAIEKNAAAELEKIRNSSLSDQDKANQTIILEARKQAQIEENDRKRRKLEVERAKFERLNSIAGIITGTSLAVVNALTQVKTLGVFAIGLAASIGALGLAQLTKALSAPIPKYKYGTEGHKGGLAIVGDGGKSERVILPSGEQFDTPSTSTLLNLPRGTKVLPDAEQVDRMLRYSMTRRPGEKKSTGEDDKALVMWQTQQLTRAIKKSRPIVKNQNNVSFGRQFYLYKQVFE